MFDRAPISIFWLIYLSYHLFIYQEAWQVVCCFCHFSAWFNFELRAPEQRKEFTWPKWCDTTINNEKWDGGSAKKPEKGKSPSPAIFDDPEGQPALPESLAAKCKSWKRIPELFANGGGTCVFEEAPGHGYKFVYLLKFFQEFYDFFYDRNRFAATWDYPLQSCKQTPTWHFRPSFDIYWVRLGRCKNLHTRAKALKSSALVTWSGRSTRAEKSTSRLSIITGNMLSRFVWLK